MPSAAEATWRTYTTRGAVKAQLGSLVSQDSYADQVIDQLILAATAAIDQQCSRTFSREALTETVVGTGAVELMLTKTPLVEVTSVTYRTAPVIGWVISDAEAGFLYLERGWTDTRGWGWSLGEQRPPGQSLPDYAVTYIGGYLLPSDDVNSRTVSCVALTQRYVDSAGLLPTLVTGERLLASGFAQASNNGWKTVVSATADYIEVTGEPLVDEAVPADDEGSRELKVRTLPRDIEQACIETCKAWYIARKRDQTVQSKRVGDLSVTYASPAAGQRPDALPFTALGLLGPYERLA